MLGLADSGNPIGQAVFAPLAGVLTTEVGWRWAYRIFGVVFAVLIALPNGLLQRRPPETVTVQKPYDRSVAAPTLAVGPGGPSWANRSQGNSVFGSIGPRRRDVVAGTDPRFRLHRHADDPGPPGHLLRM